MNKKLIGIIGIFLAIIGISMCFCVAIFFKEDDILVKLERGGVCNPLNPDKDKEIKISDSEKDKIRKYWKDVDLENEPDSTQLCDCVVGDYKLSVDDKVILFNLDLSYVSIDSKNIEIDKEFLEYIKKLVKENDTKLEEQVEEKEEVSDENPNFSNEECCSCCPDLKLGESCITACCECS